MLAYRRALSVAVRSTAGKCRGAAANEVDSRGVLGLGSSSSSSIRLFSSLPDHAVVGMPGGFVTQAASTMISCPFLPSYPVCLLLPALFRDVSGRGVEVATITNAFDATTGALLDSG